MKRIIIASALTLACAQVAFGQNDLNVVRTPFVTTTGVNDLVYSPALPAPGINNQARCVALIRSDRAPRQTKFLKLWPGKETTFYYSWVLEDGSTVTKIEKTKAKGVPDERPLKQSHPNIAGTISGVTFASGPITAAFVSTHAKL